MLIMFYTVIVNLFKGTPYDRYKQAKQYFLGLSDNTF